MLVLGRGSRTEAALPGDVAAAASNATGATVAVRAGAADEEAVEPSCECEEDRVLRTILL